MTETATETKSATRTHAGGCHCGKVRFEVTADVSNVMSCNCSICQRTGALMVFVGADKFKLEAGGDHLTDYQFGKKHIHHQFCSTCGVRPFGHGKGPNDQDMYAINVRCLDDIDLEPLTIKKFDGKSL
jgi:hypothetical protein